MLRRFLFLVALLAAVLAVISGSPSPPAVAQTGCSAAYPDFCIPPPPPDVDCGDAVIAGRKNFTALAPDPHRLDEGGVAGLACEDPSRPRFPTTTTNVAPVTTTTAAVQSTTSTTTGAASQVVTATTTPPPLGIATGLLDRTG